MIIQLVLKIGAVRVRPVLFCQRRRTRSVPQIHPEDQEKRHHAHERHGDHATGAVANKRRHRLNGGWRGGKKRTLYITTFCNNTVQERMVETHF